ncbi:MAG: YigZ family protein [Clostridiales bacterium]|nr:YigZ family protein [Clostridiales bacterium]MDD6873136.1 YigZ family protein [Clostridiales bacterium]MDD7367841.1 YigZ family protein [Clostridiales bacterium]
MAASYKTLMKRGCDEFIVNKSRFIGYGAPAETEEEALAFLAEIRKKHADATHNCYAYIIGRNMGVMRYSDDGEPGGTAGMPIIEVMKNRGVVNACVVVTRYFGGVLLGAGGLVRAYTQGAVTAIDACGIGVMHPTARYMMDVPYPMLSRVEYFLKSAPVIVEDKDFSDVITLTLLVKCADEDKLLSDLTQLSEGRLEPMRFDETYMAWPEA